VQLLEISAALQPTGGPHAQQLQESTGKLYASWLSLANSGDGQRFGVWTDGILGPPCILFINLSTAVV